jgi:hypothetical protein
MARKKHDKSVPFWIVVIADKHCGHKLGLLNPSTTLPSEADSEKRYKPKLTDVQKWLWNDVYIPGLERCAKTIDKGDYGIIINGDALHGIKYPESAVSMRASDHIDIAVDCAMPATDLGNLVFIRVVMGTSAHNFGLGAGDIGLSERISDAVKGVNIRTILHGYLRLKNVLIDYRHAGTHPGTREWLRGDNIRRYTRDIIEKSITANNPPPQLLIRSHYHDPVIERVSHLGHECVSVVTPPLCLPDYWTTQSVRNLTFATAGFLLIKIQDGRVLDVECMKQTIDLRTIEEI